MIKLTHLGELTKYFDVPDTAMEFLSRANTYTECGRYEFSEDCFVNVITCDTKEDCTGLMEAHVMFVDVQYMLDGEEKILYTPKEGLVQAKDYDEKKDRSFYAFETADEVTYTTGEGIVLYPAEAHLPGCAIDRSKSIKKAVIKIRYKGE